MVFPGLFRQSNSSSQLQRPDRIKIHKTVLFFVTAAVVFTAAFFWIKNMAPVMDEITHFREITEVFEEKKIVSFRCPYPLGYHWSIAILCRLGRCSGGPDFRFCSSLLSFLCVIAFFKLAKKIDAQSSLQKSFLFLFFPAFFPFFFVIYTDIYAMLFLFLSLLLALNRRLQLAGVCGILSILIRHNNVIWVIFIGLLAYFEHYYPQHRWADVKKWVFNFFFFFLAILFVGAFIVWNQGFVFSDKSSFSPSFSLGNLFLFLFLFFFFFLPQNLSNGRRIFAFLERHRSSWIALAVFFVIHMLFFKADHTYNQMARILHNGPFILARQSLAIKAVFFLPVVYAALSLCVTPLRQRSFYLLYPFAALFLLPLSVVEIRYLFPFFAFFLLLKKEDSKKVFLVTLAGYIAISCSVVWLMLAGTFFP